MDFAQARYNMVEQQVRPWDVLDRKVLDLLETLPRDKFVPAKYREIAYADTELPLGHGESMLPPRLEARLVQELDLQPTDKVLEIGTGSGYMTAMLASLAAEVVSVEIEPELSTEAAKKLADFSNIKLIEGDGSAGWATTGPYDAILLTGSVPVLPDVFREQLKVGGRLVAIIGQPPIMTATLVKNVGTGSWLEEPLFDTIAPPLRNVEAPKPEFHL